MIKLEQEGDFERLILAIFIQENPKEYLKLLNSLDTDLAIEIKKYYTDLEKMHIPKDYKPDFFIKAIKKLKLN